MNRSHFLALCAILANGTMNLANAQPASARVAGVDIPDTALAREADALAREALPGEIYRHCLRTYFFASLLGQTKAFVHDPEALYVASILHDIGLSPAHMSEHDRFEVDGANAARSLMRRFDKSATITDTVWDAIALHDNGGIARWKQPEVVLLNAGVSTDFGDNLDVLSHQDVAAVLRAAPRTGFVPVFLSATADVARRKPTATGTCFVTDVAYRMVPGFHHENFCDAVKDDPFAGF